VLSESGSAPASPAPTAVIAKKAERAAKIDASLVFMPRRDCPLKYPSPGSNRIAGYPLVLSSTTAAAAPNKSLINVCNIAVTADFQSSRMRSLSCCDLTVEDYEQDGLRARAEQALGELAQALIDNPTLHDAVTAALGAREKALEAQQAAMSALNLPSATDVERLERRLRSFSQRLEDVEEAIDDLSRELGALRRENAKKETKKPKKSEAKAEANPQP